MPHLINLPRAPWRQQPPSGTDLADPGKWEIAVCLNTPIYHSAGVNGIGWSTGGAPGSVFLSGADPTELTQTSEGVIIQDVSDYNTGCELKILGIVEGAELVGSLIFVFKSATSISNYIYFIADRLRNYIRYSGSEFRVVINNRATIHTIPSLLDGQPHVLAIRLYKGTYLNRAVFLDGKLIDSQDQSDTAVFWWESTDGTAPPRIFAWQSYYNRYWDGINQAFFYTSRYISDSELIDYTENVWRLFKPRPARFILIPSSGGTVHILTGSGAIADTLAAAASITQTHALVADAGTADTLANTASITQDHNLSATDSATDTQAATGLVTQIHALTGVGNLLNTLANTGAVFSGTVHVLTGTSGVADCLAATGATIQTHALAGTTRILNTLASTGPVTQTHLLAAVDAIVSILASTGSLAGALPAPNTPQIRTHSPAFGARARSPLFTIRSVD